MNLNEKLLVTKRKYTDNHPAHVHSTHAPVRSVILDAIAKNGGIIDIKSLEKIGVNKRWLIDNKHLIKMITADTFKLTDRGQKLLQKLKESDDNLYDNKLDLQHELEYYLNKKNVNMNIKYLKDKINESACINIDDYAYVASENIIENYMIDSIVGHMIDVINMDGNYDKFLSECYGIEINYESLYNDCCFVNEADNQQPEGKLKGHFKKHWKKYAAGAAVAGAAGGAYMAHKKGLFKGGSGLKDANHLNKGTEKTDLHNRNVPLSAMKPHERAEALKSTKAAAETRKAAAEKAKGAYRNDKSYGDTFKDAPADNKATRAIHGAKSWLKDKFKKK